MPFECQPLNKDIFFFDREDLQTIADKQIISQALTCFKENRVLEIDQDDNQLWAMVEDESLSDVPMDVAMAQDDKGVLHFTCTCEASDSAICLHQIAALYAYADQNQEVDGLLTAVDTAIKDRIKRAKSEVKVEAEAGQPWFGSWRASSINSTFPRNYRVVIRNIHRRVNFCSCPDFAGNQLGTCKHIEAVLHKIKKHPDYDNFKEETPPVPYIYLAWKQETEPQLHIHRSENMAPELQTLIARFFTASGEFKARIPEDFLTFVELTDGRNDIHIGDDALDWANHLSQKASHRLRAADIKQDIENSRGRLPGVKARLYPYQVAGTAFLAGTGRAILADDMGLGKTIQAIAAAVWLKAHEGVEKIFIVCPASLKQQWAREIAKFSDLQSQIIGGPPHIRKTQYRRQVSFFIINYELILRDLSVINQELSPDLIIMDEAQRIKNWRTKIASAIKLIPSRYAFVLTGTPLENKLEDLYSLMQVVDPKILGPLWRYMVDFHVMDERGKILGYRNLSILRKRLEPVMLRRDRSLVSDQLPERTTQRLDVGMTEKQLEIHGSALQNAGTLANIAKRRPLTPTERNRLMAALQQARMACNAAGLVDKETEGSPKLDELVDLLDEICIQGGNKAVIFSQWELMTRMVEPRLRKLGLGYVRLHGGVPTAKRGALMDSFREDESVQIFLSTDAGGVGLNLQSGSVLINLDVPWNPAVLEQRNARIHRLGQKKKVQIITMVAADSYEEHVLGLLNNKQNLFDNVVKGDSLEDVMGVSQKLLDTLTEDLAVPKGEKTIDTDQPQEPQDDNKIMDDRPPSTPDNRITEAIRFCIAELQQHLGPRIERILGAKGGLIVVLDQVDSGAESLAVELSATIPVAIIDLISLNGLNRLGASSPLAEAQTYYEPKEAEESGPTRLATLAQEKLKAARVLIEQNMANTALELLLAALMAKAADMAELDDIPSSETSAVWLFSDAVPKGILTNTEAALIMQVMGLSKGSSIPEELMATIIQDATDFIAA